VELAGLRDRIATRPTHVRNESEIEARPQTQPDQQPPSVNSDPQPQQSTEEIEMQIQLLKNSRLELEAILRNPTPDAPVTDLEEEMWNIRVEISH
jgi:hypothetical protein